MIAFNYSGLLNNELHSFTHIQIYSEEIQTDIIFIQMVIIQSYYKK